MVRPRRSKKINTKKINSMDDAQDPYGNGKDAMGKNPRDPQEGRNPLQCWRCGGPHLHRVCPHGEGYVRTNYNVQDHGTKAVGKREQESSPNATATIRSLRAELQDCKEENKRLVKDLVEKNQMTSVMLQSLEYLQRQVNFGHHLT